MKLKTIIIIVAIIAGIVAVWYFLIRKSQDEAPALESSNVRGDLIRTAAPVRGLREEVRTAPPRMATAEGGVRKIR